RVQDPATMPLRPTGLRFMHFAIGGLMLAILLPLGVVFLRARFDPRIRSASHLSRRSGAPLLAVIPTYQTPAERRQDVARVALGVALVATVVVAYGLGCGYEQLSAGRANARTRSPVSARPGRRYPAGRPGCSAGYGLATRFAGKA